MSGYKDHWSYRQAVKMIQEAQEADIDGLNRLVQSLIMKPMGWPCRGHGACIATGKCPYKPPCVDWKG